MKRKFLITAGCIAFVALALFSLSRGARKVPPHEPNVTMVVDLSKTNAPAQKK